MRTPTRLLVRWLQDAYAAPLLRYGLSKEYVDAIVLPSPVRTAQTATLERQVQAGGHRAKGKQAKATLKLSTMAASLDTLSDGQRRALLHALHQRLRALLAKGGAAAPVRPQLLTNTLSRVPDRSTQQAAAPAAAAPKRGRAPAKPAGGEAPKCVPLSWLPEANASGLTAAFAPQEARQSWRRWQHRHRLARRHGL